MKAFTPRSGRGGSVVPNDLAKPLVTEDALLAGYRATAADGVREDEAMEWADALIATPPAMAA